jgi:hypothetical protein
VYCDQCGKNLVTTTKEEGDSQKKSKKSKKKTCKQIDESVHDTRDNDVSTDQTKEKNKKERKKKKPHKKIKEEADHESIPESDSLNPSPDPSARLVEVELLASSPLLKNTDGSCYWGNPHLLHETDKQQREHDDDVPLPSQHHSPSKKDLPPILGPRITRTHHPKEQHTQLSPLLSPHQSSNQQEENRTSTTPRLFRAQRSVSDTTVEHKHRGTIGGEIHEISSSRDSAISGGKHLAALPDLSKVPIPRARRHERRSIDSTMAMNIATTMNNSTNSSGSSVGMSGGKVVLWGECLETASKAFQAKEVILAAEIEADERCLSFLKQRFVSHSHLNGIISFLSIDPEIQRKKESLERKIQMNKEKLTLVRERLQQLGQPEHDENILLTRDPSNNKNHHEQQHSQQQQEAVPPQAADTEAELAAAATVESSPQAKGNQNTTTTKHHQRILHFSKKAQKAAVVRIQALYRGYQARQQVMALLISLFQRIYDPESDRFFFYNTKTQQSLWEFKSKHLSQLYTKGSMKSSTRTSTTMTKTEEATRKIQRLYRSRAARQFMRDLAQGVIQKCFDEYYQTWYYYNRRTNQSYWEKPKLLAAASSSTAAVASESSSTVVVVAPSESVLTTDVVDQLLEEKFHSLSSKR